ncbi:MAG: 50S ribosomal protein L11 methyltransferase [Bacteroidota bacterium]
MNDQIFLSITCSIPEEYQDLYIGCISEMNISGIEQSLDVIQILFDEHDCPLDIHEQLLEIAHRLSIPFSIVKTDTIHQQNWNKEWEDSLEPIFVNEMIAITPEWKKQEVNHPLTIIINPQMAFGTGYHPTTRMVCRELYKWVQPESTWIDAGCGSGVLAILTSKLRAKSVFAFDNDEWSVQNSIDNCLINDIVNVQVKQADIFTIELEEVDGIAANMYRNLIIPNFKKFYNALQASKGMLILSGILTMDADEIISTAISSRFEHICTNQEGDWVSITLKAI